MSNRRRLGLLLVVAWIGTRLGSIAVWRLFCDYIRGDVGYYYYSVLRLPHYGIERVLTEYPTPVVWGLQALAAVTGDATTFMAAFMAIMLLLDAIFTIILWRDEGPQHELAVAFWLLFVPLLGPLLLFRFDLIPAICAGLAVLWMRRRPHLAGAMVAIGAAFKLWPALLILPLLKLPTRRKLLTGFVGVGGTLGMVSLAAVGLARNLSPMTWQGDRGLQVESVVATPLMVARLLKRAWKIDLTRFNAYEIAGPGVALSLKISDIAMVAGLAVIGAMVVWIYRQHDVNDQTVGLCVVAIIAIMILTNKTLSPQYIVWLAGPSAAIIAHTPLERRYDFRRDALALSMLLLALSTQLVYPLMYGGIVDLPQGTWSATLILVVRNLVVCVVTVGSIMWAMRPKNNVLGTKT